MDFEVIGPAAASPGRYGPCSCYRVCTDRAAVLLDCGPGAAAEFVRRHDLTELTAIVLSHMHPGHALDAYTLARAILAHERLDGRPPLRPRLYLPPGGAEVLVNVAAAFGAVTSAPLGDAYDLIEYDPARPLEIEDLRLDFIGPTNHPAACWAMRATAGGAVLAYSADSAWDDRLVRAAEDADLFLCEATNALGEPRRHHLTAGEAARAAALADVRHLLLTHHRLRDDESIARLRNEVQKAVPCTVDVAVAGLACRVEVIVAA